MPVTKRSIGNAASAASRVTGRAFALIVGAYVPTEPLLEGTYKLPDVQRL
jgi:hypothetical protein